jgi:diguanylate cyclase (GGDEF)-like protein
MAKRDVVTNILESLRVKIEPLPKRWLFVSSGCVLALFVPSFMWIKEQLFDTGYSAVFQYRYFIFSLLPLVLFCGFGFVIGQLAEQMKKLSDHDELTGLRNQRSFYRTSKILQHLCERTQDQISMIMIDIDHFKTVNDNHNHIVGSDILKQLAAVITNCTRGSDICCRFGGDEYAICLPRTNLERAQQVAERIRKMVAETDFVFKAHKIKITISAGVSATPSRLDFDLSSLLESADRALYQAKNTGRNRTVVIPFQALPHEPKIA